MIDYSINSGPQGGLTFEFIPAYDGTYESKRHYVERAGADVFSIKESAFLFLEKAIADAYPDWNKGYYYGVCYLPLITWQSVFKNLEALRVEIGTALNQAQLLEQYVPNRGLLDPAEKLDLKALSDFLDLFEGRAQEVLSRYPYLAIGGI